MLYDDVCAGIWIGLFVAQIFLVCIYKIIIDVELSITLYIKFFVDRYAYGSTSDKWTFLTSAGLSKQHISIFIIFLQYFV